LLCCGCVDDVVDLVVFVGKGDSEAGKVKLPYGKPLAAQSYIFQDPSNWTVSMRLSVRRIFFINLNKEDREEQGLWEHPGLKFRSYIRTY